MKRKLLTILLLSTLSISLIGCEKKVVYTGDPEVDAEIQEMWDEELENDSDSDLEDSNNRTKVKIRNSYLVSNDNKHYLVLDIKTGGDFNNTGIRVVGENIYGDEKELCDKPTYHYRTDVNTRNKFNAPFKYEKNTEFLIIDTDWDGYDSYSIEIYPTDALGHRSNVSPSNEYYISSSDIEKFSEDDFIEYMTEYMFDTTEETNIIEFNGLEIEYVNIDINEEEYSIDFSVKNTSNLPTDAKAIEVLILPKNDISVFYSSTQTLEIPTLVPGEEQSLKLVSDYMAPIKNLSLEPGNEFLIQIIYNRYPRRDIDVKYFKIKC